MAIAKRRFNRVINRLEERGVQKADITYLRDLFNNMKNCKNCGRALLDRCFVQAEQLKEGHCAQWRQRKR